LSQVKGISKEKAEKLIEDAKKLLQENKVKEDNIEEGEGKLSEEGVIDGEV